MLNQHGYQIAPSTFYGHAARGFGPTPAELDDAYAANELFDLWAANWRVYGARKLHQLTARAGASLGRDQVARLMRITGITGAIRGRTPTTTVRNDKAPRHPDLVKRAWHAPVRPDQLWVADFTYVRTIPGFCYVSFITDVFSRRILGWTVATNKETPLVTTALEQALAVRRRTNWAFTPDGLIHHSDAGSQYTSLALGEALLEAGVAGSIGTVGDALDNALMESTIGLYKTEVRPPWGKSWPTWRHVETATARWVHWFNNDRLHSGISYHSPIEYEERYDHKQDAASKPAAA